jgi:hypothetical protein
MRGSSVCAYVSSGSITISILASSLDFTPVPMLIHRADHSLVNIMLDNVCQHCLMYIIWIIKLVLFDRSCTIFCFFGAFYIRLVPPLVFVYSSAHEPRRFVWLPRLENAIFLRSSTWHWIYFGFPNILNKAQNFRPSRQK